MNKRNVIYLTPHSQYDSKYRGYKIVDIYAPWGGNLQ